jgi:hypothetical protein
MIQPHYSQFDSFRILSTEHAVVTLLYAKQDYLIFLETLNHSYGVLKHEVEFIFFDTFSKAKLSSVTDYYIQTDHFYFGRILSTLDNKPLLQHIALCGCISSSWMVLTAKLMKWRETLLCHKKNNTPPSLTYYFFNFLSIRKVSYKKSVYHLEKLGIKVYPIHL